MSNIPQLANVPEISFIDGLSLEGLREQWFKDYSERFYELTGERDELPLADPIRLIGYATTLIGYQCLQYIDRAGKTDLLKYSYGDYLDNIGALKGLYRKQPQGATTTLQFTASALRPGATGIPGGTRVTDEAGNTFATNEYVEIPSGQLYVTVQATSLAVGTDLNGIEIGDINKFVDPVPYISAVTNISVSSGADDVENDDDFTYRILMHPSSYSVAGPKEAYEYWAKTFRTDIEDVLVYTPAPTEVVVLFMLEGGVAPDATIVAALDEFLSSAAIRPLTDKVTVAAPTDRTYTISLTYYINRSDANQASAIQNAVAKSIEDYKKWQRKIGRDINPSELIKRVIAAGAKRVELREPGFVSLADTEIAEFYETGDVIYGGLEDD